ncbi:hypothetical protein [Methanoculleus sp.]|uniref:hypothetical protein n=1 Tax=Methanoculleus sp. TaxID=90427 RepID=UPI001BD681E8|nr:hypothetical protein [Methanoculleus sp.]
MTVENGQTAPVTAALITDDLDGDGLPDIYEENGYRDGFGNWHAPDPDLIDTDGDGLSDGYEAGEPVTVDGKTYYKQRSDPTRADTDDDGLDDFWEDYLGTDPFSDDTDGDGLLDGEDDEPLIPADPIGDIIVERLRQEVALRLGALFGETGLEGEEFNYLVGDWASHPYYALGWIASGIAVYGDVRDFLYAVSESDTVGAAINGIGLVPYLGDCGKTAADVAKYLVKYPDNLLDVGRVLFDQHVIQLLPDEGQLNVIDHLYLFATGRRVGTELATEYGLTEAQIVKMQGRGVKLDTVVHVTKVGDDVIPIREVSKSHYVGRHVHGTEGINQPGTTLFPTSEPVTSFDLPYPGTSALTRAEMEEKILDWLDRALPAKYTEVPENFVKDRYPFPEEHGVNEIGFQINEKGILTVFPTKGSQVYMWDGSKWIPQR